MFNDNDELKKFFRDFLKDEIDELKQHKYRFFALVVSLLLSLSLIFTEDSGATIEVSNSTKKPQIQQTKMALKQIKRLQIKKLYLLRKIKTNLMMKKLLLCWGQILMNCI